MAASATWDATMDFSRSIGDEAIDALKLEPLFARLRQDALLPDVRRRDRVFPALRNNKVDFYHGGGGLFSWSPSRGFATHVKYASVLEAKGDYVTESELADPAKVRWVRRFIDGYDRIKENCRRYAGVEAAGVAHLYQRAGYACCADDVVVLDIEAAFPKEGDGEGARRTTDRIDLVLLHKPSRTLRFVEAKHYSNTELWSAAGSNPAVVSQLTRYRQRLEEPDAEETILKAYGNYAKAMTRLLDLPRELAIPQPETVETEVPLLLFGFDAKQRKRIAELLTGDGSLDGFTMYAVGDVSRCDVSSIWNNARRRGAFR